MDIKRENDTALWSFVLWIIQKQKEQLKKTTVRSHIGWGGEQSILYKGVETSP